MKIKVAVKQYHIDNGHRGSHSYCPIALAFADCNLNIMVMADGRILRQRIGLETDLLCGHGVSDVPLCELSEKDTNFIGDFDHGRPVKPFEFEVEINER